MYRGTSRSCKSNAPDNCTKDEVVISFNATAAVKGLMPQVVVFIYQGIGVGFPHVLAHVGYKT